VNAKSFAAPQRTKRNCTLIALGSVALGAVSGGPSEEEEPARRAGRQRSTAAVESSTTGTERSRERTGARDGARERVCS
jgi:hypothetical protein